MKPRTKINRKESCQALFEIEVSREDIDRSLEEIYDEFVKIADIPGFRVGKAPRDLVKKRHRKAAEEEALKRLISKAYSMTLNEHKVHPISMPEITDVVFEEGKPLSFKAKVDTRPEVKLKDYKRIKIEKKKEELKEEDAEKTLENMRALNAKYIAAEDRPLAMGDYAVCDIECSVDGKPLHKRLENRWFAIEKDEPNPELIEKITGMKKLEERDCEVTLSGKYPNKNVAGKKAVYHVKLKEIKVRRLPDLDDEFAKDLGKDSLEALKNDIREELRTHIKRRIEQDMELQLLTALVGENTFSVPRSFVDAELRHLVEDAKAKLIEKGFKKEDVDSKEKEFEERFRDDAVKRIKLLFILDEIARRENISVTESEIEDALNVVASRTGQGLEKVKEYYKKEELANDLKEKLREDKTIQFLLKEADIREGG